MDSIVVDDNPIPNLQELVERALDDGAAAVEIAFSEWVVHEWTAVEGAQREGARSVGALTTGRVYLDGGKRPFSVSSASMDGVASTMRKAIDRAAKRPESPYAGPADRFPIPARGMGVEDPRYPRVTDEHREGVLRNNDESVKDVEGVHWERIWYRDRRRLRAVVNSRGVKARCVDTSYEVGVRCLDETNGRTLTTMHQGRNYANVGSLPYGLDVGRRLVALRDVVSMPPGDKAIVLESRAMAAVLDRLAPAFSARLNSDQSVVRGAPDDVLGHSRVHLIDDAGLNGGVKTRPFDDRGVPPMPVPLIRDGRLGGLYYDPETARISDVRPTGHVINGELGPSNLMLRAGNRSRTQMLGEVPLALCFDHLEGSIDLRSGEMRMSGPAHVLERGQRCGVIADAHLHGNVLDLLRSVVEVSSDQSRALATDCATTLIKGFPVS